MKDEEERDQTPAAGQGPEPKRDESLRAASKEAVRFMEDSDEPGHAGRGDGG